MSYLSEAQTRPRRPFVPTGSEHPDGGRFRPAVPGRVAAAVQAQHMVTECRCVIRIQVKLAESAIAGLEQVPRETPSPQSITIRRLAISSSDDVGRRSAGRSPVPPFRSQNDQTFRSQAPPPGMHAGRQSSKIVATGLRLFLAMRLTLFPISAVEGFSKQDRIMAVRPGRHGPWFCPDCRHRPSGFIPEKL